MRLPPLDVVGVPILVEGPHLVRELQVQLRIEGGRVVKEADAAEVLDVVGLRMLAIWKLLLVLHLQVWSLWVSLCFALRLPATCWLAVQELRS